MDIEITIRDKDSGSFAVVIDPDYVDEAIDLLKQSVFFKSYPEASILDYIRYSDAEA